jgi:hypothetical protein
MDGRRTTPRALGTLLGILILAAAPSWAQVTPAAGYTPPDDTPTFRVGVMIFTDYTYQDEPTSLDANGNEFHPQSFNVGRAYINVIGNINHLVSYRVTPDISRLTTTTTTTGLGPGQSVSTSTSLDGSLTFRLKYAYGQFNLDEPWSKGSWVRLGVQQTPYVDFMEGIYRYRFQGTILVDREGELSSSDFGLSTHYNFPGNFGDVHGGYYNGDTYARAEPNDQKAVMIRATLRPAPNVAVLKGLRVTAFYDHDDYLSGDARRRFLQAATFEHKYVVAGFERVDAVDQPNAAAVEVKSTAYSAWAVPKFPKGFEGLLRYDRLKPNRDLAAVKERKIVGGAYWFKTLDARAGAAILLDYETVDYDTALAKPTEKRYAVHTLFTF